MSASLNWIAWNSPIGRAELLAVLHVGQACVEAALRLADGERRDRDASVVELREELVEALARLPEEVGSPARGSR